MELKGTVYDSARITAKVLAAFKSGGWKYRGEYDDATIYYYNDVVTVTKAGLLYLCIEDDLSGVSGKNPTTSPSSWTYITGLYFEDNDSKADNLIVFDSVNNGIEVTTISPDSLMLTPVSYSDGNLIQFDENGKPEDSGVPAADVVTMDNPGDSGYIPTFDGDRKKLINSDLSPTDILSIYYEAVLQGEIPILQENSGIGNRISSQSSKKTIDNVKTELGYLYIPASAFEARKTNGATYTTEESTTYDQTRGCWLFNAATSQGIQIVIPNYGSGSLTTANFKYKLHTKIPVGGSEPTEPNNTVQWLVKAVFEKFVIDQKWETAVGTKVTYDKNFNVSEESALVTAAGSLDTETRMWIEINRYADDTENDLLAQDVAFLGIEIQFNLPTPS